MNDANWCTTDRTGEQEEVNIRSTVWWEREALRMASTDRKGLRQCQK